MFTNRPTTPKAIVLRLVLLGLAFAGVFWARCALENTTKSLEPSEIAPIPEKLENGK